MKKVVKKLKQSLSILLAVAMVITCVPQTATLAFAASDTDIIDTETSTEAETPAELDESEAPADEPVLVSDEAADVPMDTTAQPDMADDDTTGDDTEVELTEGNTPQELDPVETDSDVSGSQATPFAFEGKDGDGGDVTFDENENVTINETDGSKGLTTTSGSEAYYFQVKANENFEITKVTATAKGTVDSTEKTATLATDATDEAQKITSEAAGDYTKYTIPLNDTALGEGFAYTDLTALEIAITATTTEEETPTSYTVTLPEEGTAHATVAITSGATKGEDNAWTTTGEADIVFTVTPSEGYKVTDVSFASGTGANTPLELKNDVYTISAEDITGDVVITVTTAAIVKYTVSVKDYTDKATNHYEVYQVTKAEDGTYAKADTAYTTPWSVEEGTDVYFVVEAAEMYEVKTVNAKRGSNKLEDGAQIYQIPRVSKNEEIEVTMQLDIKAAYSATFTTAEGADALYKITTDGDNADTKVSSKKVYTAKNSINLTITPDKGYQVEKVEKVDSEGAKTEVTTTSSGSDGAVGFAQTFSDTEKEATFVVTVTAKALDADGGKITFVNNAENLTLTVTSAETAVAPVDGEEGTYQVKKDAQYVEFTLTSDNEKILPVVKVGDDAWESTSESSPYAYKISASLFATDTDTTTITITQEAVMKKLTVVSDSTQIDFAKLMAVVGETKYTQEDLGWDEFEGIEYNDYKEFDIPIDSEVVLYVEANDEYKIASYQIGDAKAQDVNEKTAEINLTLEDDTLVIINPASDPTPYTVTLNQGSADGSTVEADGDVYPVDYGKTYVATVSKAGMICNPAKLAIDGRDISSTVAKTDSEQRIAINVAREDAGKELTVKIWVEADDEEGEPSVTLKLQVSKAITGATITGVKSKKLTQTVDTEQAYEIKVTPADADVNNLVADIKWAEGASEAEKAAFTAAVVDGRLVITTATAKDADAAAALNTAAQKATIRLADKTKGSIADGNYPDEAIVNGTDFKLTIAAPTGLTGVTPTVVLKSSDDVELTLTLGVPANKIAEPNLGKLWYEVIVAPQGDSVTENNIKPEATYYFAKNANSQDETIVVSDAVFGSGRKWSFNVTVKVVQTLSDFDLTNTTAENYETDKAAALTAFASKEKKLATATKDPYFATKLTLKKGTTNVYTGMENIKIATIDFGKDTTYKNDDYITVTDLTTGYGINPITEFDVSDGNVYLSIPLNKGSYSNVTLGKHTIRVTAQSPDRTWAAYADLVITVNRGIEFLDLNVASYQIYKAANNKATLKVTPVYNKGNTGANYAAKTKKVKDYVLVTKDEDGNDVVINDKNLTVKNGTVTVAKDFDLTAAKANGTDKFYVRATSADWTDKASGTSSSVYGYSRLITITEEPMVLGDVLVVRYDDNAKNYVPIIDKNDLKATSGEFGDYNERFGYYNAQVVVLKSGVAEKAAYDWDDFVDYSNLTFKSSNAKALGIDSYGWITAVKTGKNIKITVSANDGSKASKTLDKIEIENAKPEALGLKVERVNVWGNEELNGDYANTDAINFTGTTNSVLQLTVMRQGENGNWYELDELTDLKVTISKAKVLNKVSAYNQKYTVIANTAAATVKLQYTDKASVKQTKEFTINNNGVVTAAAPKLKASGNLVADYHDGAQTVVYTLSGNYDYKGKVVMVNTDATDRNNSKNTYRYQMLENAGNVNEWTGISEDGTFELNFEVWNSQYNYGYTYIPAGSYKLSFTFGTVGVDGSFIPDTKPVNMTLKAVAPKTVKFSYKPVTTVKMSVYDTAAGKTLTGTGKGITYESYSNLLNANITGQANNFRELFELNGNVLKLKSSFSDGLKAALLKAGEITENSDAAVIEYITASKSKAAKNDRIGYVNYYASGTTGYAQGQTKITVTFDTKKSTDTYTLTNTTILQGTTDASVQVLKNKKAEAVIEDAYVIGCDKDGKFEVSIVSRDAISFTLADETANTANKYKVTVAVVPANNYYAAGIAAKKAAWEAAKKAQSTDEAAITAAKQAYVDAITDKGIKLTTTVTVGAKATTKNKISVAKNNLKPAFTGGYSYVDGVEAGYDGKNENYWIHVPYTKNMACVVVGIDSNDNKLAAAREDGSQNLVSFNYGVQDWDSSRDDYNSNFIDICLNKNEFEAAVDAGKVKYSEAKKKATLAVKATVHFGSKWVVDNENPNGGYWDTETVEGKDAVMTEVISFTLTLPSKPAANGYDAAVSAVEAAKDAIAAASVPESWIWNGEGLPLPDAEDGVITLSSNDVAKRDLLYTLNGLICNVREEVEKIASSDTNVVIRMPQECDNSTGVDIMTLKAGDFTAPTTTTAGTLKVRADLYDAATCGDDNQPILVGDNKSTVTTVEFTLTIPALKEKPADVKAAIVQFISEKENDSDYIAAITGQDVIERDARIAAGLVDENGNPTNSLRLRVDNYNYYPASIGFNGSITGDIIVYGYRYGGQEISEHFDFTIQGLDSLAQTKTKVEAAVNALTATNATTKEEILAAANAAIKNPQFSAVWQKAGEGTLKDESDKDEEGNAKPVSDSDGDVYKLKAADRTAAGYVIGTIVIVDSEDETVTNDNLVSVNRPIAQQAGSDDAAKKVKEAVGFDASGNADANAIKALVLKYGNSEEKVKAGILKEANKVVKNDGYTVAYKKDTEDATKVLFKFEPVKYKATGSEGQEGYDSGKGSLEFTLEITDDQASEGATPIPDVVMAKQGFGPFVELQTLEQAKADVDAALKAFKDTITNSTTGNAVNQAAIEGVVNPKVTGTGLTVAVEDFEIEEATVKAKGSITCKVVITKTVEGAADETETIEFEAEISKVEQTLADAKSEAQKALNEVEKVFSNDDIETITVEGEGEEEDTEKDVVKADVLSAIKTAVEEVIDTDSFTVDLSKEAAEYTVQKATIQADGKVKITVTITEKEAADGEENPRTEKVSREWTIAELDQSSIDAEKEANSAVQAYATKKNAEGGIEESDLATVATEIIAQINAVVKVSVYKVEAKEVDSKTFVEKEADSDNPARYEATFILKYTPAGGEETTITLQTVVINKKTAEAPASMVSANSVSANDSER